MNKLNSKKETVKKLNFSSMLDKLSNVTITEKKTRENLYIYPDNLKTEKDRNSKEGKKFRSQLRRTLDRFADTICIAVKYDRQSEISPAIDAFKKFYKINYRINDFSIGSVSQRDDAKNHLVKMMFEIIVAHDAQIEKKAKKNNNPRPKKIKNTEVVITPEVVTPVE